MRFENKNIFFYIGTMKNGLAWSRSIDSLFRGQFLIYLALRGELWPAGVKLTPGGDVDPIGGRPCVHPSLLLEKRL
jgi:hypothetical protein